MSGRRLTVDEILEILPNTPVELAALTAPLGDARLSTPLADGEWSLVEILAHLRACSDVLGGDLVRVVTEDRPSWRAVNPRTWQHKTDYDTWPFRASLDAFTAQRDELLKRVQHMSDADWQRTATVLVPPGKVYERTAQYYGEWLAQHERTHVTHLRRTLIAE
jgi:DinB family protein